MKSRYLIASGLCAAFFAAGVALGLALLKFQFAVPFAVIFLLRRQWRFLGGFAEDEPPAGEVGGVDGHARFLNRLTAPLAGRVSRGCDRQRAPQAGPLNKPLCGARG